MCVNLALLPNKKYSIHGVCLETTWCLQRTYFVSRIVTPKMRGLKIMIEELERRMPVKEWPDWRKRFQHPNTSAMRCPYCPRYSGYKTHPDLRPLCISIISHSKKMFQIYYEPLCTSSKLRPQRRMRRLLALARHIMKKAHWNWYSKV